MKRADGIPAGGGTVIGFQILPDEGFATTRSIGLDLDVCEASTREAPPDR